MIPPRTLARVLTASMLFAAVPAMAQRVEIIPDCDQPPEFFVQHMDHAIEFTTTQWVEGEIRLRVIVINDEGGFVDMTESAQWIVDDPSLASVAAGVVTRPNQEIVRVTACIPGIGEAYEDIWEMHPTRLYLDPPPRTQPGVPVPRPQIVTGIIDAFVQMRHLGLPVIPLQGVASRVDFLDDRENANRLGQGWIFNGQDALTAPAGQRTKNIVNEGQDNEGSVIVKNPTANIMTALSPDIANAMAQREGVTETGVPTPEMRDVLNEVVDAAIMELQQDKDVPGSIEQQDPRYQDADGDPLPGTNPEDLWSSAIPERVIERMAFILEQARADTPDLQRITNALRTLAQIMKDLKKMNTAAWEKLMRKLGWEDLDNDGIPDVFEDKLRDLGIDVDALLALPNRGVDDSLPMTLPSEQEPK